MTTHPDDDHGDAALLRASQQEPEAFGRFYDRHATDLLRFFYRRTACAQTAADLTAETFAQAFAARGRFRDLGVPARAWLFAIARHQLAREARGRRVSDRYRRRLGMQPVAVDDLSLERIEALADLAPAREAINAALRTLPQGQAEAVVLRVGHDLPYAEVARRLGCSEGAARVRVTRALTRLADLLEAP